MDSIIYKVIFKAISQFDNKNLDLIFRNLTFEKPLTILNLTALGDKSKNIIFFQNIEEVIPIGNINPSLDYNYYKVILFTRKSNGEKKGYLIGNAKNVGDIIIGIWPFNQQNSDLSPETILNSYDDLLNNPGKYSKICVISQKST
ncbi:MAG: hypothetical protein ACFE8B_07170 [Candidatus Hermodarchaeota archaeon]